MYGTVDHLKTEMEEGLGDRFNAKSTDTFVHISRVFFYL